MPWTACTGVGYRLALWFDRKGRRLARVWHGTSKEDDTDDAAIAAWVVLRVARYVECVAVGPPKAATIPPATEGFLLQMVLGTHGQGVVAGSGPRHAVAVYGTLLLVRFGCNSAVKQAAESLLSRLEVTGAAFGALRPR